ncbi:MAG: tetratricopeptide repeat protein [Calditrichaeota bacterium]|nr:tetratricopeptide repeat protein [Calditrichota bacterium]
MSIKYSSFILLLISFFIFSCAGSRKEEPPPAESTQQQQDLTDIEALLGIDTKTEKPKKKKKKTGEKLNLLDENEVANPDQSMAAASLSNKEKKNYEKKIKNLQRQLRDKDRLIQQLKDQLNQKSLQVGQAQQTKQSTSLYVPSSAGPVSKGEYEAKYEQARQAFEARDYQTALTMFQALLAANANHPLADNAQYWIGESHYALKQYDAAIIDFQKVFTFPNSNKLSDAQFKLVLCYLRKGEVEKAREEFDRLKSEFPDSPYVSKAETILSKY